MAIIYRNHANLISLWDFENSGSVGNDVVGSNDLTNNGGVSVTSPYNSKQGFYAGDFETGDFSQYLSITDGSQSGLDITGSMTITLWVNLESLSHSPGTGPSFCGKYTSSGNQRSYTLGAVFDGADYHLQAIVSNNGSSTTTITGSANLTSTGWYHVAFVYNGSSLNLYLNGLPDATPVSYASGIFNSTSRFEIGNRGDGSVQNFMDGQIDEVAVFDDARSEADINDIMGYGIWPTPKAYYVSSSDGSDSNSGLTTALAWQTTAKVDTEFEDETFYPGDRILFERGDSFAFNSTSRVINLRNCKGTIAHRITLGAYGTGARPYFNDAGGGGDRSPLNMRYPPSTGWERRATHLIIQDIEFTQFDANTVNTMAVRLMATNHILIQRLYVHNCQTADVANLTVVGIQVHKFCDHIVIRDNVIKDIGGEGVYLAAYDEEAHTAWIAWVMGNTILDCDGEGIEFKQSLTFGHMISNYLARNGSYGTDQIVVNGYYHRLFRLHISEQRGSNKGGIRFNNGSGAFDDLACYFSIAERCLVRGQTGTNAGISLSGDGNEVRNCVLADNAVGLSLSRSFIESGDNQVHNCLFDNNTRDIERLAGATTDYQIDNNGYADGGGSIWYWTGVRDLSYVQGTLGFEANALSSDPLVENTGQYILQPASPYIDEGDSAETAHDYEGSIDIGWWEDQHRNFAVFEDLFDDLSAFSTVSGAVSDSATAKHRDTRGLLVEISTTAAFVSHTLAVATDRGFFRFHINLDNVTASTEDSFKTFRLRNASVQELASVEVRRFSGEWRARATIYDDSGNAWSTAYFALTSDWNCIELWWLAAQDSSNNFGEITLYINAGSSMIPVASVEGINNNSRGSCSVISLGAIAPIPATCSGSLYLASLTVKAWEYVGPHGPVRLNDPAIQAYWAFPSSSLIGLDSSTNGNTLTNAGASFTTTAYLSQGAGDFEAGDPDFLSISHASQTGLQLQPPLTLIFRCRFETDGVAAGILSKQDAGGTANLSYALRKRTDGRLELSLSSNGTSITSFQSETSLLEEVWYHVVVVADGIDVRFYIEGVLDSDSPGAWSASLFASTGTFRLGRSGNDYMDGILDSVFILDRALDADEAWWIARNHVDGTGTFTEPPGSLIFIPEYINYTPAGFGMM